MCVEGEVYVCVSVCLRVSLGVYGGGGFVIVVLSLCEALCVAFKYEKCHIKKV